MGKCIDHAGIATSSAIRPAECGVTCRISCSIVRSLHTTNLHNPEQFDLPSRAASASVRALDSQSHGLPPSRMKLVICRAGPATPAVLFRPLVAWFPETGLPLHALLSSKVLPSVGASDVSLHSADGLSTPLPTDPTIGIRLHNQCKASCAACTPACSAKSPGRN